MLETLFFILGLVNSLALITIFLIRKTRLELIQRYGWTYLLLAIPAAYGLVLALRERPAIQYAIFLAIFLAFLIMEGLLDYILKINFRSDWKRNWKWILPYLILYYAMNYGFVIMPWKQSKEQGLIMLALLVIQIAANIRSHPDGTTT